MSKLYFDKSAILRDQELRERLLALVESGIAKTERQGSFRSLYDIEIAGVTIYYQKNWHFNGSTQ